MIVNVGLRRGVASALSQLSFNADMTAIDLDSRITATRASTKTYFNSSGTLTLAAIDEFPAEYDPVTLQPRGRSIWEARTNLLLNSLLDGTNLATQNVTVAAIPYTLSFYGTGTVTLSGVFAGALVGSGAFPTISTLTFTPAAGALTCTVTGTVQFANIEAGSFSTAFIPTAGATATRSADIMTVTGANFNSWYNQLEGTFMAEYMTNKPNGVGNNSNIFSANDTTAMELVRGFINAAGVINNRITAGGVSYNPANTATQNNMAFNKYALAYGIGTNKGIACLNGATPSLSSPLATPVNTRLQFGSNAAGEILNGWIRTLKYWRTRLPDTTIQSITL